MTLQEVVQLIQGVGFPGFVAVYLLIFFNTTIRENTEILRAIKTYLEAKSTNNGGNNHAS